MILSSVKISTPSSAIIAFAGGGVGPPPILIEESIAIDMDIDKAILPKSNYVRSRSVSSPNLQYLNRYEASTRHT